MKRTQVGVVVGLIAGIFVTSAARAAPDADTTYQIVRFKAPAGWASADPPGGASKVYTAADSNLVLQTYLVVAVPPPQPNFDFAATFDRAMKAAVPNATITESTDVAPAKTRQGYGA